MKLWQQLMIMMAFAVMCLPVLNGCGVLGGGGASGDSTASAITLQFDGIEKQGPSYVFKRRSADGSVAEYVQTDSPLQLDLSKKLDYVEQKTKMNLPGGVDQECQALLNSDFVLVKKTDLVEKHSAGSLFFAKPAIADAQAKEGEEAEKRYQTVEVLYGLKVPKPQQ